MDFSIEGLRAAFERNLASGHDVGAAVAVWHGEEELISLYGGFADAAQTIPWGPSTLCLVWSATKGVASACVLHAMEAHRVELDEPVSNVWPEFGVAGKNAITFEALLSHQAGLAVLREQALSVFDHEGVAAALAGQEAELPVGATHAYGPRTFGYLLDEIVRRISSISLGAYWREALAEPLNLEFWIGLPETEHDRVAQMLAPKMSGTSLEEGEARENSTFLKAMGNACSPTRRAFTGPAGLGSPSWMNTPSVRLASLPSMGGIGTAQALAKFYAMLASGGQFGGQHFFSHRSLRAMEQVSSQGLDGTLLIETAFSAGFMKDPVRGGHKVRQLLGPSLRAFGHPGAGGSLAFADPERGLGFAYVMNQMELGVMPGARALALVNGLLTPSGEDCF